MGLNGCSLHTNVFQLIPRVLNQAGTSSMDVTIPCDRSLVGGQIMTQVFIYDTGAPRPMPFAVSNAVATGIGGFGQ
jgi:hypothetical protein